MKYSLQPKTQHYIHTQDALLQLIPTLENEQHLCVDTEFHAENRYTPKLMLIQIADLQQNTWIIDPLQCDIAPLADALQQKTLIMHGAKEDLLLLQRLLSIHPTNIIDVQIAAALLGTYYPTRLSSIIEEHLDITTPQHQTLTDWSKRPLSSSQLYYAAEDASSLVPLYRFFTEKLQERLPLLSSICSEFAQDTLQPSAPQHDWLHWGVTKTLPSKSLPILAELMAWREKQAQAQNRPPNYILPRAIAIDIARREPSSLQALKQNRRINSILIKKHGNTLLSCIQRGKQNTTIFLPFSTEELRFSHLIQTWAQAMSHKYHIDANLLIPQDIAMTIVRNKEGALQGWRKTLLHYDLLNFLQGNTSLRIRDGKITESQ